MKTIVRFLIAVGIVFTAVFLTSACKDDDKNDQTTIIGNWTLVQSEVDVTLIQGSPNSEAQVEAAIASYINIAVNSRVIFSNTKLTFTYSLNGGEAKTVTYDYTLNDGTLSVILPIDNPSNIIGDAEMTDNVLKINLQSASFLNLLKHFAAEDADFKTYVDQLASASIYYRLKRN